MAPRIPDMTFTITYSKWKMGVLSSTLLLILMIPLFVLALFGWELILGKSTLTERLPIILPCLLPVLFFGGLAIMLLKRINKPLAVLSHDGFTGTQFLKTHNQPWTPETVMYYLKGKLIIANPDASQSWGSRLWKGPNTAIILHSPLAREKREDVIKALKKLNPYPIKETTIWNLSKRN